MKLLKNTLNVVMWLSIGFSGAVLSSRFAPKMPLGAVVLFTAAGPFVVVPMLAVLFVSTESVCALNCDGTK